MIIQLWWMVANAHKKMAMSWYHQQNLGNHQTAMSQQLFGRFKSPLKDRGFKVDKRLQCHNWLVLSSVATASIHWDAPISNFHGTSYFSNPLEVPHQTARFNPKRKHNNWQIWEEIIMDFTFFRHRRRFTTPVEQPSPPPPWGPGATRSQWRFGEISYKWRFWHGNVWLQEGHPVTHPISWENDENPWGIDKYWHFGHKKKRTHPNEGASLNGT